MNIIKKSIRFFIIFTGLLFMTGWSLYSAQDCPVSAGFGQMDASMSSQQVVYVDRINGNDIYGDGTVSNPYKTITKGLRESVYGQVARSPRAFMIPQLVRFSRFS